MFVVIMAGGKGTRIASVNADIPKPLLRVCGKPVLQHQIECLARQGFQNIILVVGYLGDQIKQYFSDGKSFGVRISYIQEESPLGTAGALFYLKNLIREDFFLINGDLIFDVELKRMMCFHLDRKADATLLVHPNNHPYDSGIIIADEQGKVNKWLAKEDERKCFKNCVNAGIHILSPKIFEQIQMLQKLDLDRDVFKPHIPSGRIFIYKTPEYIMDMGTPERIVEVERDINKGLVFSKNLGKKQKAVFLDRDGVINKHIGFLTDIQDFELLEGVSSALKKVNRSGYLAIVITNQPVIARGDLSWDQLNEIHNKMETLLGLEGAYIDDIFVCPHHPEKGFLGEVKKYKVSCECRKPKPGMLLQAAFQYNVDLASSWMIGDSMCDIEAGIAAGCNTLKVSAQFTLKDAINSILLEE